MKLKNVVILGDSYSTYEGYIPEGYAPYYTPKAEERSLDVTSVDKTWWHMLSAQMNFNIVQNNSWSGSTVSYIGWSGDCSTTSSFIVRARQFIKQRFFEEKDVDTLLIFGATNDSWVNESLGELKLSDINEKDLYSVLPAISYLVSLLREEYPTLNIVYIINTDLKPRIVEAIHTVCDHFGALALELEDIDKKNGHPTALGMRQIKDQVMRGIENA